MAPSVSETLVAALPPDHVRFGGFAESGHNLFGDEPECAFAVLREFIAAA
ncbi:hypothetical protein [Methylobacterium sp. SyP6R]|nr:hypothetical protein [Methylobacterium sp. SyP6R]MCF4126750.1 hypothetical protein [Methylobacterium sp. SyP6R]